MPRSRRTLLASLAGGFGVVGSIGVHLADRPTDPPSDVESFQYDAANTGTTDATTGPGPEATERWRADIGQAENASPVLVDDAVICASSRHIAAFDRRDGSERWRTQLSRNFLRIGGSPAVDDGRVFVPVCRNPGGQDGVHALDVETGDHLWHALVGESVSSSLAVVDGVVYSGGGPRHERVVALDAATGDELWYAVLGPHATAPAVVDDVVYAGGGTDGDYVALDAATGDELWRYETEGEARTAPTIVDDTMYVGVRDVADDLLESDEATLRALAVDDGSERWRLSIGTDVRRSVAVADSTVYVTSAGADGSRVVAVDARTPEIRWTSAAMDDVGTAPVVVDQVVYVGLGEELVALEAPNGTDRWSLSLDAIKNTPVVADGVVYVQTYNWGNLYAFETA